MRRRPSVVALLGIVMLLTACGGAERAPRTDVTPERMPDLVVVDARAVADGIALRLGNKASGAFQGTVVLDIAQGETHREAERSIDLAPYDDSAELVLAGDWDVTPDAPEFEVHLDVASGPGETRTDNNTVTFQCGDGLGGCDVNGAATGLK